VPVNKTKKLIATKTMWNFSITYKWWHHWSIHHRSSWTHSRPWTHSWSHHVSHDSGLWLRVKRWLWGLLILGGRCRRSAGRWRCVCSTVFIGGWCYWDISTTAFAPASDICNPQQVKGPVWLLMELHLIATECHLSYGITVLPTTLHKWTHPALNLARQVSNRFTYPRGIG